MNPLTGLDAPPSSSRIRVVIKGYPIGEMWLPEEMLLHPFVAAVVKSGGIRFFIEERMGESYTKELADEVIEQFTRIRCQYDFAFWCYCYVIIKNKGGGEDVPFRLNHPQCRLVEELERQRTSGSPIRLVLLKARQWGGSTCIQMYMSWLQLCHKEGLNSLIVGHVKDASNEVRDMFDRMIRQYPVSMLYPYGTVISKSVQKVESVGQSTNIHRLPSRNCKIKIGTAERPDSARGGDYNLVHCTEVGMWKTTEGKTPEQIIRSATSGVLYKPYTMIVYESTANGTGNFFQREYDAAKSGSSQFRAMFVPWYEIEQYREAIPDPAAFREWLIANKEQEYAPSDRQESGKYLWWLHELGADDEAVYWYTLERAKYRDHADMASEYPSDDVEAFVHSGSKVFDRYKVEALREGCRAPRWVGEVRGAAPKGQDSLIDVHFSEDKQGRLWVWEKPDIDSAQPISDRYLVVVDIGGRSDKADYSVIVVFDRIYQMDGDKPVVVAQWYGHIDMDLLAWRAAQIATWYDDALLVIESNTLETKDRERWVEGDLSMFVLDEIKLFYCNLYARRQSQDDIREGRPKKYGFHTNTATKPLIIETLVDIVRDGLYVERDTRCLDEFISYERKPNGAFGAILGKHDDLLMTRAIGLRIAYYEMELPRIITPSTYEVSPSKRRVVSAATI